MTDAEDRPLSTDVIVGVGSSAGGLPALRELLAALPDDPRLTLVIAQHQSAQRESALAEILQASTERRIVHVADGMRLLRGVIHVAPQSMIVDAEDVAHFEPGAAHLSIDRFFRSLADSYAERTVGVVLSGSGGDGTAGLLAIKRGGGLALVQDPATAAHDGMPSSALRHGAADLVGAPAVLARRLGEHAAGGRQWSLQMADDETAPALRQLLPILRARTGHDFSRYKPGTMRRRLARRMAIHRITSLDDYVRVLERDPLEADALFSELLIGVTRFFRDAAAFDELRLELRRIVERKQEAGASLRVWVPGCSTGEEAYSVAILIAEVLEELEMTVPVCVFATDIDADAIDVARTGVFRAEQMAEMPSELAEKYFEAAPNSMRIRRPVREMLIFAPQSLIADPPFMHVDLISCRNVLIYLNHELQEQLIPLFHFSLDPDGLLFLGTSEGIGVHTDLFEPLVPGSRVFRRLHRDSPRRPRIPMQPAHNWQPPRQTVPASAAGGAVNEYRRALLTALPPSVVVDSRGQIAFVHGHLARYLEPAEGLAGLAIADMARRGLRVPIVAALRRLEEGETAVVLPAVSRVGDDAPVTIELHARRVTYGGLKNHSILVFVPRAAKGPAAGEAGEGASAPESPGGLVELELELQETREHLEGTLDELNTSNEELQSANEELQSANEELQSANEELETSREETLSLNEELRTVNAELESRVESMARANDDLVNLLNATEVATVFVSADLAVRRFTASARRVIRLRSRDIGRPLEDLTTHLVDADLAALSRKVLDDGQAIDTAARDVEGRRYRLRVAPYQTSEDRSEGVVITLVDASDWSAERDAASVLLDRVVEPALVLDAELLTRAITGGARRLLSVPPGDAGARLALGRREDTVALRDAVKEVVDGAASAVLDVKRAGPIAAFHAELSPVSIPSERASCALLQITTPSEETT